MATAEARHVLVTGASRGFGRLIALELARRGWHVHAAMRELRARGTLERDARAVAADPGRLVLLQLDVTDTASVEHAVESLRSACGGRLDAAVLNAGIAVAGCFEDVPETEVRRVFETNVFGTLAVARAVLPLLRARAESRLVAVSSDAGFYGTPALSAYTASKHALEGWAESLAIELRPLGVRVVILEPGNFKTEMLEKTPIECRPGSPYAMVAERAERLRRRLSQSAGDPQAVARRVADVLERRRPPLRCRVGMDARAMHLVRRTLPDRARLTLVARVAGIR